MNMQDLNFLVLSCKVWQTFGFFLSSSSMFSLRVFKRFCYNIFKCDMKFVTGVQNSNFFFTKVNLQFKTPKLSYEYYCNVTFTAFGILIPLLTMD
jgi:hypothetical protein